METAIIVFTVIINLFAILLNIKMLTGVELTKKLLVVVISEIAVFALVSIVYAICSSNVQNNASKNFIIFTFLGVNMILIGAPIAKTYAKKNIGDITDEDFKNKIIKFVIGAVVMLILEGIYISSIVR